MITVLMVAALTDVHARACAWALERYGCKVIWFDTAAVGTEESWWSVEISSGKPAFRVAGRVVQIDAVWDRRRYPKNEDEKVFRSDRDFVARESRTCDEWTLGLIEHSGVRWIDSFLAVRHAENKFEQLIAAAHYGLAVPDTLVSRHGKEIRNRFPATTGVVVKPLSGHLWLVDGMPKFEAIANRIDEAETLSDQAISICPAIYQAVVARVADIRAVVIGGDVYATRFRYVGSAEEHFDCRVNLRGDERTQAENIVLPASIREGLLATVRHFGLTFSSTDFAEDADGNFVFLDLNPQGQFLYNEVRVPAVGLLDAMARHIVGPEQSQDWPALNVRLADYHLTDDHVLLTKQLNEAVGNAVQPKGYYALEETP